MLSSKSLFAAAAGLAIAASGVGAAGAQERLSRTAILAIAAGNGMASVEEVERDDGHWEVEGRDSNGRELEFDIHGRTGAILERDR